MVDNFGVKYVRKEDAQHLMDVLEEHYTISKDRQGEGYNGIALYWEYATWKVHLSMPEYVKDALVRFAYKLRRLTHQSHKHTLAAFVVERTIAMVRDDRAADNNRVMRFYRT